jgi:signal transduction histidine kinase
MRTSVVSIGVAVAVTAAVLVAGVLTVTALYLWLQSTPAERREPPKPGDLTLSIDAGHVLLGLALVGGAAVVIAGVATLFIARRAVRPLEDAFDRQRRFVADASHELRTPLTVLHARIQLLSRRVGPDSEAAPLVRELSDDAQHLIRIVNDLLAASAEPAAPPDAPLGTAPEDRTDVHAVIDAADEHTDVHAVIEDAVLAAQSSAGPAPLGVVVDSGADPLSVRVPTAALRQCVLAVLDNALRHSPTGGTVRIAVARAGRLVTVDVHDDGPALTGADADRLFDRFAHRPPAAGIPAPGAPQRPAPALGLFLVRETITRHGGSVAVVPAAGPGAGTTIRLLLPVA